VDAVAPHDEEPADAKEAQQDRNDELALRLVRIVA